MIHRNGFAAVLTAGVVILSTVCAALADDGHTTKKNWPKCPVMGEPANLAMSATTDDGPVFVCCKGCIKKINTDPAEYAKEIAEHRKALAAMPKVQVTCPVSGEPVDEKTYVEHAGEKVHFCCNGCSKKFQENPSKYHRGLANSYTYQTKCPVMGETINPVAVATMPTGEKVYFCCKGCDKKFMKDPAKFASKLEDQGYRLNVKKIIEAIKGS